MPFRYTRPFRAPSDFRRNRFERESEAPNGSRSWGPIVCVGETLDEREAGRTEEVVDRQIRGAFEGVPGPEVARTIVAYEPVWAIGTGLTATPEQAEAVHRRIREALSRLYGESVAAATRILYGGSVKPGNAGDLFSQPNIDGGLIGGAALNAQDFLAIVGAGCSTG
jgi:triosephosphate isomerase